MMAIYFMLVDLSDAAIAIKLVCCSSNSKLSQVSNHNLWSLGGKPRAHGYSRLREAARSPPQGSPA
jgi:hypothetical protein